MTVVFSRDLARRLKHAALDENTTVSALLSRLADAHLATAKKGGR